MSKYLSSGKLSTDKNIVLETNDCPSLAISGNLLIYVTKLHKCDTPCQLYVVFIRLFILQIIKRAFNILKVFSTHMCINFRRPATTMSK